MEATITIFRKGARIGIERDGKPIGYATRIKDNRWTTTIYTAEVPFDRPGGVFNDEAAAIKAISDEGTPPPHLL